MVFAYVLTFLAYYLWTYIIDRPVTVPEGRVGNVVLVNEGGIWHLEQLRTITRWSLFEWGDKAFFISKEEGYQYFNDYFSSISISKSTE